MDLHMGDLRCWVTPPHPRGSCEQDANPHVRPADRVPRRAGS